MKKTKVKIPAKINLTLDVSGKENGFHNLKSLVASINLYDAITLCKNNSGKITVREKGIKAGCKPEENNAYKTAKIILDKFQGFGVDILIQKQIPVGAGLGGSSADIAGVLVGLDMFLGGTLDLYSLAKSLGSDVNYMMSGGYAVLNGKGDDVEYLGVDKKIYLIILTAKSPITAKDCFKKFDEENTLENPATNLAVDLLIKGDKKFLSVLKNDLYIPAIKLLPEIEENYKLLSCYGNAVMTGSGNAVLGVYYTKKERDGVCKKLKKKKIKFIKAETI